MNRIKTVICAGLFCGLGACSGPTYKCPIPDGVGGCRSVDRVYQDTQNLDNADAPSAGVAPSGSGGAGSKADGVTGLVVAAGNARAQVVPPGPGAALISVPQVLRILVTPWQDSDGDLEAGGYLYLRLDRGQWTIP